MRRSAATGPIKLPHRSQNGKAAAPIGAAIRGALIARSGLRSAARPDSPGAGGALAML
jgi:hypothetical protein